MSEREKVLELIVRETLWMARRYAHNRQTYAPTAVNECIDLALKCGIKIEPDRSIGGHLYACDGDLGKWNPEVQKFAKEIS